MMGEESKGLTPPEGVVDDVSELDEVEEADLESFPASDPPSSWAGSSAPPVQRANPA
jgi:hypothetical protein